MKVQIQEYPTEPPLIGITQNPLFSPMQNIHIGLVVGAFARLIQSDSRFLHQAGKHYRKAEQILFDQLAAALTGEGFKGVAAFDELKQTVSTL